MVKLLFLILCGGVLLPFCPAGLALVFGIAFAILFENPFLDQTRKRTPLLLQFSVVGLGAAMNLQAVAQAGAHGFLYTILGISFAMGVGLCLGKLMKIAKDSSLLITVGTAICGGSAIAAVAPTIRAKTEDVSVSLATVFLLNAVAVIIFPTLGHLFGLNEQQFGLWSALAIHDTSSVVGAAMQFGPRALETATTVKLARALWIVPLTLLVGYFYHGSSSAQSAKKPWFILGFITMAAVFTWLPDLKDVGGAIAFAARRSLVLTLFLIGTGISKAALKQVGVRPLVFGTVLWFIVGAGTLVAICLGFIS